MTLLFHTCCETLHRSAGGENEGEWEEDSSGGVDWPLCVPPQPWREIDEHGYRHRYEPALSLYCCCLVLSFTCYSLLYSRPGPSKRLHFLTSTFAEPIRWAKLSSKYTFQPKSKVISLSLSLSGNEGTAIIYPWGKLRSNHEVFAQRKGSAKVYFQKCGLSTYLDRSLAKLTWLKSVEFVWNRKL